MLLDKILNTVFSFGAAVVIFGAWGKIEHAVFGDTALTAGLLTETAIFFLYGLLEWVRRPDPAPREHILHNEHLSHDDLPAHKQDLEALTNSIKETSNLLSRIFRV
jgi:hypothetical protein